MESTDVVRFGNEALKARPFADIRNLLAKNSPEILVVGGVAGVLVGTVLACRATLKAPEKLEIARQKFSDVKELHAMSLRPEALNGSVEIDYTEQDYRKDMVTASLQTALEFGKLYAIPAAIMGVSLFAIFKGHGITVKRNAGLAAAVSAVTAGYNGYRQRVRDKFGDETEADLYYARKTETIETEDPKTGKIKKSKLSTITIPEDVSGYAKYFDESSSQWQPSPELNLSFLRCTQNYLNDKLRIHKVLFLNEAYEMLGLPRTEAGQVVGWALNAEGDDFVDLGIYRGDTPQRRDFVNGTERSILLDFNVNGMVYTLL